MDNDKTPIDHLNAALNEMGARHLGTLRQAKGGMTALHKYHLNGKVFFVEEFTAGNAQGGFEIYTPIADTLEIPATIAALKQYIEK